MQDESNGITQNSEKNNNKNQSQEESTNQDGTKKQTEKEITTRKTADHTRAVYKQKLDDSLKSFEEILRILHSTNWRNQQFSKKSIIEIEMVTKNAIMSLKGL